MAITFTWNNPNTEEYTPEEVVIYRSLIQFEADALPDPFAVLPPTAFTYTDDTAVDGVTYFFRVSFKLGVREMVSRLIEIKAPTSPEMFSFTVLNSLFLYSEISSNNYGDQAVICDDFLNGKHPIAIGSRAQFGLWAVQAWKSEDTIAIRLVAMMVIQKFKRTVWDSESFTLVDPTTIYPFNDTSNDHTGWHGAHRTGLAYGCTMTWHEAFNFLANVTNCMDVAFNIFYQARSEILMSFNGSRGQTPNTYLHPFYSALRAMIELAEGMSGYCFHQFPFRGAGEYYPGSAAAQGASASVCLGNNPSGMSLIRLFREVFRVYPEIKSAFAVKDQVTAITYKDAGGNQIDYLATATNCNYKVDASQHLVCPTHYDNADTYCAGPRTRGINGQASLYSDMFAATGIGTYTGVGNGAGPSSFFLTTTPNGKDFALATTNGKHNSRALFAAGATWNKASAYCPEYTDGLTDVDPLESQVALRYIPKFGLVDKSPRGTAISMLGAFDPNKHQSALHASLGFPDPALAIWGTDTAGIGTIKTGLNMLEYIRAGTSFTIEIFMSHTWNTAAVWGTNTMDLISLGGNDSGYRYPGVGWYTREANAFLTTFTSHTSSRTSQGYLNCRGKSISSQATFNLHNGNDFFYHVVLQYDAIKNRFEFFVNGLLLQIWTPFTPAANLGIPLCFFGLVKNKTDQTTQMHYDYTGAAIGELLVHEIAVTLAKRYNYACFIGKVPFARKRFLA